MRFIDEVGKRYGRLVVLSRVQKTSSSAYWYCQCDCGQTAICYGSSLRSNATRSCGCFNAEAASARVAKRNLKHGHNARGSHGVSPTYISWQAMIQRCDDPQRYGAKGIQVCERWLHSFENFLADMGERPTGKTLDRYPDSAGNYEPGNCRWATSKEQSTNKVISKQICIECGNSFESVNTTARFCSKKCKGQANRNGRYAKEKSDALSTLSGAGTAQGRT